MARVNRNTSSISQLGLPPAEIKRIYQFLERIGTKQLHYRKVNGTWYCFYIWRETENRNWLLYCFEFNTFPWRTV
jgi:hypothetical protein